MLRVWVRQQVRHSRLLAPSATSDQIAINEPHILGTFGVECVLHESVMKQANVVKNYFKILLLLSRAFGKAHTDW